MNARTIESPGCRRLSLSDGLTDWLHRRRCAECRNAARADAMLHMAVMCMRAEVEMINGRGESADPAGLDDPIGAILAQARPHADANGVRTWALARRALRRTVIGVASLVCVLTAWTLWLDRDPGVKFARAERLPSPNAFEYFREAGARLKGDAHIAEQALRLPHTAELHDHGIGSLMPPAYVDRPRLPVLKEPPSAAEAAAVVAAHKDALEQLRRGLEYAYAEPVAASHHAEASSRLESYRSLAWLLALEAHTHLQRGKIGDAAASYLDAIRFGVLCQNDAPRTTRLTGIYCAYVGRSGLWDMLPKMAAGTAARTALTLQDVAAAKPPIGTMVAADIRIGSAIIARATSDPFWRFQGWTTLAGRQQQALPWYGRPVLYLSTLPTSRAGMIRRYENWLRAAEARASTPYPRSPSRFEHGLLDFFGRLYLNSYQEELVKNDLDTAQNEILAVALAAHAYRLERGRPAPSIGALVDARVLRRVPTDPFDPLHKPIRYSLTPIEPVIYSVGPDGRDDAGVPAVCPPEESGALGVPSISETTKGDIVGGWNIGWRLLWTK